MATLVDEKSGLVKAPIAMRTWGHQDWVQTGRVLGGNPDSFPQALDGCQQRQNPVHDVILYRDNRRATNYSRPHLANYKAEQKRCPS